MNSVCVYWIALKHSPNGTTEKIGLNFANKNSCTCWRSTENLKTQLKNRYEQDKRLASLMLPNIFCEF